MCPWFGVRWMSREGSEVEIQFNKNNPYFFQLVLNLRFLPIGS